jgi:hypothetical protein
MSSNQHSFLAIVMHYIKNGWELGIIWFPVSIALLRWLAANRCANISSSTEELLIDLRELVGKHSGTMMEDLEA